MSIVVLSLVPALLLQQPEPMRRIVSPNHGLQFEVPRAWKENRQRGVIRWSVPTSAGDATIELYSTNYRRPAADWQRIQAQVNTDLGRTVDRQWEEELLQVPLLLTQISYGQRKLLIGVLYSATPGKFHFRLDSPAEGYAEAESAWRRTLNTLRPTGESLPKPDDGQVPLEAPVVKDPDPVRFTSSSGQGALRPGRLPVTVANRSIVFRHPKGWVIAEASGNYSITHPDLKKPATLSFYSSIDSPQSGVAAMNWANRDLNNFATVTLRENKGPSRNKAGTLVFSVLREGISTSGPRNAFVSVGDVEGFYWFLTYESDLAPADFAKDRRLLQSLQNEAGIEIPK